jgi:SP family sugar:H+ symporter-like MFS transporter
MGLGKRSVCSSFGRSRLILRSIRVNGAECGVESILLGVVTSVGGFLFGYDTGQISGMLIFSDFVRLQFNRKGLEADYQRNRFATGEPAGPGEPNQFVPIIESLLVSLMSIGTLIGALSGA